MCNVTVLIYHVMQTILFDWLCPHSGSIQNICRVRHSFLDAIYKWTPDLGQEGLVSFDCWYTWGAEGWNTVHSARHRYAASSRGYSSKLLPSGNIWKRTEVICFQTVSRTSQDVKICPLLLHSYLGTLTFFSYLRFRANLPCDGWARLRRTAKVGVLITRRLISNAIIAFIAWWRHTSKAPPGW